MSLIFAIQLTAVATAVLAVFAILTTIYAVRAFRKQSQEVSDQASMLQVQSEQLAEQRKVNERQTEVLELQANELRESLEERKREAVDRRSAQASRVSLAVKMLDTGRTAGDDRNGFRLEATVVNASEQQQPICDVRLYYYRGPEGYGMPNPELLGTVLNWEKEIRHRDYLPGSAPEDCGAVLTFRDAAGIRWTRMPDGALSEQSSATVRESIQVGLDHHLLTRYNRLDDVIADSVVDAIVVYPQSRGELSFPGEYSSLNVTGKDDAPPEHEVIITSEDGSTPRHLLPDSPHRRPGALHPHLRRVEPPGQPRHRSTHRARPRRPGEPRHFLRLNTRAPSLRKARSAEPGHPLAGLPHSRPPPSGGLRGG